MTARELTTTAFFLPPPKNNDTVRLIGVYARNYTFVILLRPVLLPACIISLGVESDVEI